MRTTLQSIELEFQPEVADLFVQPRREPGPAALQAELQRTAQLGQQAIAADGGVSFDSYFSSFAESHWTTFTALESVNVSLTVSGNGVVSLFRRTPQGGTYLVGEEAFDSTEQVEVVLCSSRQSDFSAEAGRLFVTVREIGPAVVAKGEWFTEQEPLRMPRTAVVFCTFNREEYLSKILTELAATPAALDSIAAVYVINQGDAFRIEDLVGDTNGRAELLQRARLIEQPNLGGCGGFTRGMWETLNDDTLTHFVLLDDDIRLHADSLLRAHAFLSYSHDNVCVGGHMLNLHQPAHVYEAGANLNDRTLIPEPRFLETHGAELDLRMDATPATYNGWWFFGAPKSVLVDHGMPLPCFIRGDDTEFGLRLSRADVVTVPVPGIAVWHEPFYMKLGGWQLFFEVRNRLAAASLHGLGDWNAIRRHLIAVFARDMSMARYHSLSFIIKGMVAYLEGPDAACTTTDAALQECRNIAKELGPTRVADHAVTSPKPSSIRDHMQTLRPAPKLIGRAKVVASLPFRALTSSQPDNGTTPVIAAADLDPADVAMLDRYMVQEEFGNGVWLYERRPDVEKALWAEFRSLIRQLGPMDSYRQAFEASSMWHTYWDELFSDLPPAEVAS